MTLYLTRSTDPADVVAAHAAGIVSAVKLYPAGATTNSASGVRDFDRSAPCSRRWPKPASRFAFMAGHRPAIDIFDREAVFIDRVLDPIRRAAPG